MIVWQICPEDNNFREVQRKNNPFAPKNKIKDSQSEIHIVV